MNTTHKVSVQIDRLSITADRAFKNEKNIIHVVLAVALQITSLYPLVSGLRLKTDRHSNLEKYDLCIFMTSLAYLSFFLKHVFYKEPKNES